MLKNVNIRDASTHLQELVSSALQGDEVILSDAGRPLVRLVPVPIATEERIPGLNRGELWISDDFDEPLPEEFWTGSL